MASFTVLEQAEEDKLHATRLLGIEERPLKRVTKRLLTPNTPIHTFLKRTHQSTDTNEPNDENEQDDEDGSDVQHQKFLSDLARFRDDVILDFAAFESSIARIQFLRSANQKERDRYAAEKLKIEDTAQDVRDNTAELRIQLDEAQRTLKIRKEYDVLADKITKNSALKPRDEQHVNIEKLKAEIEELERESLELNQAWVDRREQLGRVIDESARLRRLVRGEKEPDEEDQGDGEDEEENDQNHDEEMLGVGRDRDPGSNIGTPRPIDDAPTPLPILHESGALTPRSTLPGGEAATPQPDIVKESFDVDMSGNNGEGVSGLKVEVIQDVVGDDVEMS